ncbi:hypothetical protein GALMADRAFT_767519 [Galerina marginata CBS 339.88]|uniref:FAD-binding PCMH-type domain-containing protein n=1 Tax=Galerina marginata (strain CBS 339.88) TaxID=685588 RepID=A0A067SZR2_GALM3|nr:hypothetical protein GALMADRAFT_767519 [Galerina marginata CBS 339.88]
MLSFVLSLSLALGGYATPAATSIPGVSLLDWQALNITVQGRLHSSVPFSRPCFDKVSVGVLGQSNQAACSAVQTGNGNSTLRATSPGAYQETQWETCQATSDQCLLDWTNPTNPAAFSPPKVCSQGSIPPYFIEAQCVRDVQAAFAFSKKTKIPLSIRNTGHDYKGRSSQIGSLALWTHNLRSITYDKQFIPKACGKSVTPLAAVTYGAGVVWGDLYNFADANNITLPGGADTSVGAAGGFIQGGGHSPVSNIYGLAVDRVLEFEVVTPTGQHLFASDCQNTDLFFALKGGGGGTFGVVMSVTTRAFPATSFTTVAIQLTPNPATRPKLVDFIISQSLSWANDGWSGVMDPSAFIVLTNINLNFTEAGASMKPLRDFVVTELNTTFNLIPIPSYLSFFNNFISTGGPPVGVPLLLSSRLVPADVFTSQPAALSAAVIDVTMKAERTILFANTPFNFKPFPGVGPTSVTPAWRNSIWHVVAATTFNFNTSLTDRKETYTSTSDIMSSLRRLTPHSGAYQNEADVHEPDFSDSFWGDNYQRLVGIKRKYDPDTLLQCWQCVDWKGATDPRFRCYI